MHLVTIMMLAGAVLFPGMVMAQRFESVDGDPNLPTVKGFDIHRAIFWEKPNFVPLRDPQWRSLREARNSGDIADDTPVLVFEAGDSTLVLVSSQMAYHHVAQGKMKGEPWMVTF